MVARVAAALETAGLWDELRSDWVLLDAELMPWSAKAQELLRRQYDPTVAAAQGSARALIDAIGNRPEVDGLDALRAAADRHLANADAMRRTIDGYCWDVPRIEDHRIAPFHILAAEGRVFSDAPHVWHMETLGRLAEADPILQTTGWQRFDAADPAACAKVAEWWQAHTEEGGEGMVIKPNAFVVSGERGLVQPAMKVRGRDYLRIIYGPDYDLPENIERLRQRGLGRKMSLADREFRLGLEGLHRFVERQPLSRVHACAVAVLALESTPVDPRL